LRFGAVQIRDIVVSNRRYCCFYRSADSQW